MSYHSPKKMRANLIAAMWKIKHKRGKMPRRLIVPVEVLLCLMRENGRTTIKRVYKVQDVLVEVRKCYFQSY